MLTPEFALKIFEGFSIERWNDLARPFDLIEMDKAAEKMILAYMIGKFEEHAGGAIDWDWMIRASFFDLLNKIALSDIKSPVQRWIKIEYPEEFKKLALWVIAQYKDDFTDESFFNEFTAYLAGLADGNSSPAKDSPTARIFRAAHKYASFRELEMISPVNEKERYESIKEELSAELEEYRDLPCVDLLLKKERPYKFLLVIERLRLQTRWNQTPRVPKTSVLGHSYFVAALTMLMGKTAGGSWCAKRRYNDFFSALFHDLPEAVTRDIISPVKRATDGLSEIIKKIEEEAVKKELEPLMEDFFKPELSFFTGDEFSDRVIIDGKVTPVAADELDGAYNADEYSPVGGTLIRAADHIAAFLEADRSIKHGITSEHLIDGRNGIAWSYGKSPVIHGFDIREFFLNAAY
jgi:putative hydrolase of HD superfamily